MSGCVALPPHALHVVPLRWLPTAEDENTEMIFIIIYSSSDTVGRPLPPAEFRCSWSHSPPGVNTVDEKVILYNKGALTT